MKVTQPTMNEDIKKYKDRIFLVVGKKLIKMVNIHSTADYNHFFYQMNYCVRREVRKNSRKFFERVENLQKLILMPKQMNYDLENMGEKKFFEKWGIDKNKLVFSRLKWRENYYEEEA